MKFKVFYLYLASYAFLSLLTLLSVAWADNLTNNSLQNFYPIPKGIDNVLDQKITIKHQFNTIYELADRLNNIPSVMAQVRNNSGLTPIPVMVNLYNAPLTELLDQASRKLGYTWVSNNGVITFSALEPTISVTSVANKLKNNTLALDITKKPIINTWSLNPSEHTLRNVLTNWCTKAGWQLVWNVKADYPILTKWTINGSFEVAINQVLKASQITDMPLQAIMHDSNHVLEIYSPGDK
jgi:hypothetical protein